MKKTEKKVSPRNLGHQGSPSNEGTFRTSMFNILNGNLQTSGSTDPLARMICTRTTFIDNYMGSGCRYSAYICEDGFWSAGVQVLNCEGHLTINVVAF